MHSLGKFASSLAQQQRQYLTQAASTIVESTPAGRAARASIRFQTPGYGVLNSEDMTRAAHASLRDQGVITERPVANRLVAWLPRPFTHGLRPLLGVHDGRFIMKLNAEHGPVQLTLQRAVQPGQGDDVYPRHHGVVLLASFEHRDRRIGLLLDGNDLQRNEVMDQLRSWMQHRLGTDALGALTRSDMQAFEEVHGSGKVAQSALRLVDLDQMMRIGTVAPQLKWYERVKADDDYRLPITHMTLYDPSVKLESPVLPQPALARLVAAIDADPTLVEQFPEPDKKS